MPESLGDSMALPSKGVVPLLATLFGCTSLGENRKDPAPLRCTPTCPSGVSAPPGESLEAPGTGRDHLAAEVADLRSRLLHQRDVTDALRRHLELMTKAIQSGLTSDLPALTAVVPPHGAKVQTAPVALDVPLVAGEPLPAPGPLGFEDLSPTEAIKKPTGANAFLPQEDPQTLWEEATRAASLGDPGKAMVLLRTLERNTPSWDKADAVQRLLGQCALDLKQFPLAVAIARSFYPKFSESPLVPEVKLIEAQGLEGEGHKTGAVRLNVEVIQMDPRSPAAHKAHQALQRLREAL